MPDETVETTEAAEQEVILQEIYYARTGKTDHLGRPYNGKHAHFQFTEGYVGPYPNRHEAKIAQRRSAGHEIVEGVGVIGFTKAELAVVIEAGLAAIATGEVNPKPDKPPAGAEADGEVDGEVDGEAEGGAGSNGEAEVVVGLPQPTMPQESEWPSYQEMLKQLAEWREGGSFDYVAALEAAGERQTKQNVARLYFHALRQ